MTEYKSFDVCLSYKMVIMFFQELITLSYTATSCQFHMSWQWLKNEIELYLERHSWGPASNIWVHCAAALCTETSSERHDHLTRITTTKALSRPTSRTHSFLVVCALCNLGCLSARNSSHQLKKHQNRRRALLARMRPQTSETQSEGRDYAQAGGRPGGAKRECRAGVLGGRSRGHWDVRRHMIHGLQKESKCKRWARASIPILLWERSPFFVSDASFHDLATQRTEGSIIHPILEVSFLDYYLSFNIFWLHSID